MSPIGFEGVKSYQSPADGHGADSHDADAPLNVGVFDDERRMRKLRSTEHGRQLLHSLALSREAAGFGPQSTVVQSRHLPHDLYLN